MNYQKDCEWLGHGWEGVGEGGEGCFAMAKRQQSSPIRANRRTAGQQLNKCGQIGCTGHKKLNSVRWRMICLLRGRLGAGGWGNWWGGHLCYGASCFRCLWVKKIGQGNGSECECAQMQKEKNRFLSAIKYIYIHILVHIYVCTYIFLSV